MKIVAALLAALLTVLAAPGPSEAAGTASVSGVVTGVDGALLDDIVVTAIALGADQDIENVETRTDNGAYSFTGLPAALYAIDFDDATGVYYRGSKQLQVQAGTSYPLDHQLGLACHITGTLTDDATGAPVSGMDIYSVILSGYPPSMVSMARSANDGRYDLVVPAGTYRVMFHDFGGHLGYASEYWDDAAVLGDSLPVQMKAGATVSGIDAGLSMDPPDPKITMTTAPTVDGTARRGATLTVTPGKWKPGTAAVTIQWYAGNAAIRGATASTLKLAGKVAQAATGKRITVQVTASAPDYQPVSVTLTVRGRIR